MKEYPLSEITMRCLREAGWQPGRRVDVAGLTSEVCGRGFVLFPAAREFLGEFGGLRIRFFRAKLPPIVARIEECSIVPEAGLSGMWEEYRRRIGWPVFPLGECYHGHMSLFMAESGEVFAAIDDIVVRVGVSGLDALDAICTERQKQQIP